MDHIQWSAGTFLSELLPDDYGDWEEAELFDFLEANAWEPFEHTPGSNIWENIKNLADSVKSCYMRKGSGIHKMLRREREFIGEKMKHLVIPQKLRERLNAWLADKEDPSLLEESVEDAQKYLVEEAYEIMWEVKVWTEGEGNLHKK